MVGIAEWFFYLMLIPVDFVLGLVYVMLKIDELLERRKKLYEERYSK